MMTTKQDLKLGTLAFNSGTKAAISIARSAEKRLWNPWWPQR